MASWDVAFKIFSKWEQRGCLVLCSELLRDATGSWGDDPILSGGLVTIDEVISDPPSITTSSGRYKHTRSDLIAFR